MYNISSGSGNVKLFDTIANMQNSQGNQDGDLAVVYREELTAVNGNSEFDSCTFPNTVTLDEVFSDSIYGSFRSTGGGWFDGMVDMSSSSFRFDGYGEGDEIRVEYTSNDGITYTRTDGGEELQELGTTIKWDDGYGDFNSVIGNFMKIGGNYFEGLFQYALQNRDLSNFWILNLNDVIITDSSDPQYSFTNKFEYSSQDLYDIIDGFAKMSSYYTKQERNNMSIGTYRGVDSNLYSIVPNDDISAYRNVGFFTYTDGCIGLWADGSIPRKYEYLKYDIITGQYSKIGEFTLNEDTTSYTTSFYNYSYTRNIYKINYNALVRTASAVISCRGDGYYGDSPYTYIYDNMGVQIINYSNSQNKYICYGGNPVMYSAKFRRYDGYIPTSSQLDVTPDCVYQKTFYGKNGVENGTLTTNISNTFTDINGEIYGKIQVYYNTLTPRVLTDQDKTIDTNIKIIPVKSDGTPLLDTSNVTNMSSMFNNCQYLTSLPLIDTSNVTNMGSAFRGCCELTELPQIDTSNVTNMSNMLAQCKSLKTIPLIDTSNVTNVTQMFFGCQSLETIPVIDLSKVTSTVQMFNYCRSLKTIPLLDTSNVNGSMGLMFNECSSLETIPLLDTSKVTNMQQMFFGCTSLNNTSLNNILAMCKNAAEITSNKTLAYIGLTQDQATICQGLSNYGAFIAAGWTTGY